MKAYSSRSLALIAILVMAPMFLLFQNCKSSFSAASVQQAAASSLSPSGVPTAKRIAATTQLEADLIIADGAQAALTLTVTPTETTQVILIADGRFFGSGLAQMQIALDGVAVGNSSVIDWTNSLHPVQHSFDNIALVELSPGSHQISLLATNSTNAQFTVGAKSILSVMKSSAQIVQQTRLTADTGTFAFDFGLQPNTNPTVFSFPTTEFLALPKLEGPSAVLLSTRAYLSGDINLPVPDSHIGDALIGISFNGVVPTSNEATWSNNDICNCAELQAPMFAQALTLGTEAVSATAIASKNPWDFTLNGVATENPAQFIIGADATMIGIQGPAILGGNYTEGLVITSPTSTTDDYICVGSVPADYSTVNPVIPVGVAAWPGCPAITNTLQTVIAETIVTIPESHDGTLMILAKTRIQGETNDGGIAILGISVDGVQQGSVGVQQIALGAGNSQRTLAASFLATGSSRLFPGPHKIQVWVQPIGNFSHLVAVRDLPLLFFD